jgi:hypothetical protein
LTNNRIFELDETFFDEINSEEKAYFMGWIASEGKYIGRFNTLEDGIEARKDFLK